MAQRDAEVKLSIEIERQKQNQTLKQISKTQNLLKGVKKEADDATAAMRVFGKEGAANAERVAKALEKTNKRLSETKAPDIAGAGGDIGGGFGAASTLLGTVGLDGPARLILDLIDDTLTLGENLPRVSEGFKTITGASTTASAANTTLAAAETGVAASATAGAPALVLFGGAINIALGPLALITVALAALAAAIALAAKQAKEAREALANSLDAQRTYFELVESGSAEEIQNAIKSQEATLAARLAEREALEAQIKSLNLIKRIFTQADKELNDQLKDTEESIGQLSSELGALNQALDNPRVQERSKAEEESIATTQEHTAATEQNNIAQQQSTESIKQATAAEQQRAASVQQQVKSAKLTDVFSKMLGLDREGQSEIQKEAVAARQSLNDSLEDITQKSNDRRLDILRRADEDTKRAARELNRDLKRIRARASTDIKDALRNRDFARAAQIERSRDEEIKERKQQDREAKQDRAIALRQQLADLQRNTQIQRRERIEAFNQQLRDARAGAQAELEIKGQFWNSSINMARFAVNSINGMSGSQSAALPGGTSRLAGGFGGTFRTSQAVNVGPISVRADTRDEIMRGVTREIDTALKGVF